MRVKCNNEMLITKREDKILSLHVEDGRIIQAQAQGVEDESILGNIYIGKVRNIVKNINAAFVEYAKGKNGYLPLNEKQVPIHTSVSDRKDGRVLIGDEILVQVTKEALKTKPPTLSGMLDLTGRYLVLSTGGNRVSVSKKIRDKAKREQVQTVLMDYLQEGYGLIARTNSALVEENVLRKEAQRLTRQYQDLIQYGIYKAQFSCVHKAPASYLADIRDGYGQKVENILTDDPALYQELQQFMEEYQPEELHKLVMWDPVDGKMDAVYNISRTIDHALMPKVWLKSGAYLVIQPTEALVSIDVNTGKAISKKKDVQKTFLKVNMEAAAEIAVQLRLRNLSGMILIDFIDMDNEEANAQVMDMLRKAVSRDSIQTTVVDMTGLGLVEVTRKKGRKSLYEQMGRSHIKE